MLVYSSYPFEKPLLERVFLEQAKDLSK